MGDGEWHAHMYLVRDRETAIPTDSEHELGVFTDEGLRPHLS